MTGPEHYRAAEGLLIRAREAIADCDPEEYERLVKEAQVHALLANAAAGAVFAPAAAEEWLLVAGGSSLAPDVPARACLQTVPGGASR